MPKGVLFWVLMVIWFIFGMWWNWPSEPGPRAFGGLGGTVLLFVLLFILGWAAFGFVVQ